jgi:integrase
MLHRRRRQAAIPAIHPHQLRHTAAHNWLAAGGNEGDAMRLFGGRTREMLGRYGAALADVRAREAFRRIAPGDQLRPSAHPEMATVRARPYPVDLG